jgi:hypothetical protein
MMLKINLLLLLLLILAPNGVFAQQPNIDLPHSIRQENWVGDQGEGSCVHATTVMLFRYQRQYELADYWKKSYQNGETWPGLIAKMERLKVKWAGTYNQKDVKFLEWAMRTRRGCMVTTQNAAHMILLVHLDKDRAGIIDNNDPGRVIWKSRSQFLAEWYASNSWALTPVYTPPPPTLRR